MSRLYRSILNILASVFTNTESFDLDGVNEGLWSGAEPLGIGNEITVAIWFKTTSTANLNALIAQDNSSGTERDLLLAWRGVSLRFLQWIVWHTDGSSTQILGTPNIYDDDAWHLCIVKSNGTTNPDGITMTVDNGTPITVTAGSVGIRNNVDDNPNTVSLGMSTNASGWFYKGLINSPAIWKRVLTPAEETTVWNGGAPGDLSALSPDNDWDFTAAIWDGGSNKWIIPDRGASGIDLESKSMEEIDRVSDVPPTIP